MAAAKNKNVAKEEEVKQEEVVKEETTEETGVVVQQTEAAMINNADDEELEFSLDELDELDGLDGLRPGDFRVPYAKLFQKRKTVDGKTLDLGDILLPNGDIIYGIKEGQTLDEVCVLKSQTVRVYFPEKYVAGDTTVICRSRDAVVGAPDGEYAGQECASCEFAKFPEGGGASPCREQKLLLCTLPDGTLFHYLVSGVGVKEFRDQFLSTELQKGLRITQKKYKNKRGVMAALNLSMSIKEKDTPNGPVAVPVFTMMDPETVSNARLNSNLAAYKSYKTFEEEAIDTAATFASQQQEDTPERSEEDEAVKNSVNNKMF